MIRFVERHLHLQDVRAIRMGKGKANVDHWVAVVKPATMLFEVEGVTETVAREALSSAAAKMPVRCRFAHRD